MLEEVSLAAWRSRLERQGHRVTEPNEETVTGFTLWPDADTVITVAVEPDGIISQVYPQRFFLCEAEPERIFHIAPCPDPHSSRWLELVARQPPGYWHDFLAGPGSWLLSRLARFEQVVAWADHGLPWSTLDQPIHRNWGMDVPTKAAPFFAPNSGTDADRPRLLSRADERFADVVAACLLFASVGLRDCYLADTAGKEVYLAHHHDLVVVSIPDAEARADLLGNLTDASWLFGELRVPDEEAEDEDELPR
ncbi:MAG TPA: hypothetical protein VEL76_04545 [Gemmataceae bacterium]|nr:hypothetical protein [Gemmataceae bacterium]